MSVPQYLFAALVPYSDAFTGLVFNPLTDALRGGAIPLAHASYSWINDANSVWSGNTVTRYTKGFARFPARWTSSTLSFSAKCTPITNSDMLFSVVVDGALQAQVRGAADAIEHRYYVSGITTAVGGSTVEIWEPFSGRIAPLNNSADAPIEAGYVTGLWLPPGNSIPSPAATTVIVTVADSILGACLDQSPELFYSTVGGLRVLAETAGWTVCDLSYGSATICGDGYTGANLATLIQAAVAQAGGTTVKVLFQIGRNDWNYYGSTATSTPTAVANAIQACCNALPAAYSKIVVTPIPQTSEGANGGGFTLPNYRTAISGVTGTGVTIVDGTSFGIVPATDLTDGVHENHLGVAKNLAGIRTPLGL